MQPTPLRIEPVPGYSPIVGTLVGMLTYSRSTTLAAVEGLTLAELDHLHDATSNSIGALLAHVTAVERSYQVLTFEERLLSPHENELRASALKLGAHGRHSLRGYPLEHYLEELSVVRKATLDALAARDDAWLERSVAVAPRINAHWAWFHVAEDEINHRGQIRWLRARLPHGQMSDREATLSSILRSVHRSDHEPPPVISKLGWRYHHIGIPTATPKPNETHLDAFGLHVSGFSSSAFGVEWMRYSPDSPLHPAIKTLPHVAFEVDDLDAALAGQDVIHPPGSPSEGVRAAMILVDGAPVELIWFQRNSRGIE